jgi:hypothetical protein
MYKDCDTWGYFRIKKKIITGFSDKSLVFETPFKMHFKAYSPSSKLQESLNVCVCKGTGKVLPQQAEVAQGFPDGLRPRIFLTFGITRIIGRQPYAPAAFTPRRNTWGSFLEVEFIPEHMVLAVTTEKIPSDTTGNRSRDRVCFCLCVCVCVCVFSEYYYRLVCPYLVNTWSNQQV